MTQEEFDSIYPAPVVINWHKFRIDVFGSATWTRIKGTVDPYIVSVLYMLILELQNDLEVHKPTFLEIWNDTVVPGASITPTEATELDTMMLDSNIPLTMEST